MENEKKEETNSSDAGNVLQTENTGIKSDTSESVTPATNNVADETASAETQAMRSIPLTHQQAASDEEVPYEQAVLLDSVDPNAVFNIVASKGRGGRSFVGSIDTKRSVKPYAPLKGKSFILPLTIQSDNKSEGGTVSCFHVENNTKFRFFSAKHKDQITLVLANGKELVGYVAKGLTKEGKVSKRTFYFPRHLAEQVITMPIKGEVLELPVAKILVG